MTEFNLSEKRKILEEQILNGEINIRGVFLKVEQQDKEFIKLLKEEITHNKFIEGKQPLLLFIDKLAGPKLTDANTTKDEVKE